MFDLNKIMLEINIKHALDGDANAAIEVQKAIHGTLKAGNPLPPALLDYLLEATGRFLTSAQKTKNIANSFSTAYGMKLPQGRPRTHWLDEQREIGIADFVVRKKEAGLTMEQIYAEYCKSEAKIFNHTTPENLQRLYDKHKDTVKERREIEDAEREVHNPY